MSAVLLIEAKDGSITAVGPFSGAEAARAWKDKHEVSGAVLPLIGASVAPLLVGGA